MNSYKKFIENFSSLTLIQVYSLLLPFIIYPYLIRVSGADAYGELVLYQSYAMFMIITVGYGFDISGTKLIASSHDQERVKHLSSVLQAKFILAIISITIYAVLLVSGVIDKLVYFVSFSFLIASEVFNLNWFYLAIEKTKINLIVNVIVKTLFAITIYVAINDSNDLWLYPLLLSIGNITVGSILLYIACRTYNNNLVLSNFNVTVNLLKESFPFYMSRIMVVFRERFSAILIGLYLGSTELAFYDMCQKVINLLVTPISILNNTIYPSVVRLKQFKIVKKSIYICLVYSVLSIALISVFSNEIINLILNDEAFYKDSYLLKILSVILVLQVFIYFLGNTYLVIKDRKKEFNYSIIYSTIIYIAYMCLYIFLGNFDLFIATIGFVLCYSIAAVHRIYASLRIHYGKI